MSKARLIWRCDTALGRHNETSPPRISASGRGGCRRDGPGGGGNIGAEAVVRAPADGYTLLFVGPPNAINATLYKKLSYNFIRDIAPVAAISREPNVMVVNPSVPAQTVTEFMAYAKANPGTINMASSGNGSGPHLSGEL